MKTSLFAAAVSVLFSISGQAGMEDVQKKGEVTMNPIAEDTRIFKINPEIQAGGIRFKNRLGLNLPVISIGPRSLIRPGSMPQSRSAVPSEP